MSDDRLLLRCGCGDYHYLELMVWECEGDGWPQEFFLVITEEPSTLWERLRWLFRRDLASREIQLTLEQATQLRDVLLRQIPFELGDLGV